VATLASAEVAQIIECRLNATSDRFEYYVHYVDCTR